MSIIVDVPAMLHVGGLVHADRQFDFQIHILAVLRHYHLVKLCRFGPVCGGVKNHLDRTTDSKRERENEKQIIRTDTPGWAAGEIGVKGRREKKRVTIGERRQEKMDGGGAVCLVRVSNGESPSVTVGAWALMTRDFLACSSLSPRTHTDTCARTSRFTHCVPNICSRNIS